MNLVSGNGEQGTYEVTLPKTAIQEPGLHIYFQASDGQATSTLPTQDPESNPFQIAVLPNEAPRILNHNKITGVDKRTDIQVELEALDNTQNVQTVKVFYRKYGDLLYNQKIIPLLNST